MPQNAPPVDGNITILVPSVEYQEIAQNPLDGYLQLWHTHLCRRENGHDEDPNGKVSRLAEGRIFQG